MGVYYLIVNPTKREYLDPARFGGGVKFHNLLSGGHSTLALKHLICEGCAGWWIGDPVVLASDDTGLPNPAGLITTTPEKPDRNLYFQACEEFVDISYIMIDLLSHNQTVADELADWATVVGSFLLDLGAVLEQYGSKRLEIAVERVFGHPWRKAYQKAITDWPHWTPLPRVEPR
jgi:hypothetical protein